VQLTDSVATLQFSVSKCTKAYSIHINTRYIRLGCSHFLATL